MPLIKASDYKPPFLLRNGHLATVFPALTRKTQTAVKYQRERIRTTDNDFIDLDWMKTTSKTLAIISHGLEGNSERAYIVGMANAFYKNGISTLAWNYRGCGEEMNNTLRMYHSGATDDLKTVVDHAARSGYNKIFLIGFSLGGNLTLKYLGENHVNDLVKKSVVFSVPTNLAESSAHISKPQNSIYEKRFLRSLNKKVRQKAQQFPEAIDINKLNNISNLRDFDNQFTAPIHGFQGAEDYYEKCSSMNFIEKIACPTLVVNAENDPLLPDACYDDSLFLDHRHVEFEKPTFGGHCGFTMFNNESLYWSEKRATTFCLMQ